MECEVWNTASCDAAATSVRKMRVDPKYTRESSGWARVSACAQKPLTEVARASSRMIPYCPHDVQCL